MATQSNRGQIGERLGWSSELVHPAALCLEPNLRRSPAAREVRDGHGPERVDERHGYCPRGPLSLPPGGAHWYAVYVVGEPDPVTFAPTYAEAAAWLPPNSARTE